MKDGVGFRGKGTAENFASFVQLGLCVAAGTIEHRGNFSMIETMNIVQYKNTAIARRHRIDHLVDG